jgi:hypothetical protein
VNTAPRQRLFPRHYGLALLALAVVAPAHGQGCAFYPDANATTGSTSINPFGGTNPLDPPTANQALLFKVPRALLPAQRTRLREVGFASTDTRDHSFELMQIRFGQSTATTLDPVFSMNMTGFTATGISQSKWRWRTPGGQWTFVGLHEEFPFDPQLGDLVVFITVAGAASTGTGAPGFRSDPTVPSVLATGWSLQPSRGTVGSGAPKIRVCWDAFDLQTFGGGCVGSNGRVPRLVLGGNARLGGSVSIGLQDALATSPAALLLLDPRLRAAPIDLGFLGAPGCAVNTFFTVLQPLPLQNGAATVNMPMPAFQGAIGAKLWIQWAPIDPGANALQLTTSTIGRILLGS